MCATLERYIKRYAKSSSSLNSPRKVRTDGLTVSRANQTQNGGLDNEMVEEKEWLYRAIRTFIQAALGYAAANIALIELTDSTAVKTLLASAISGRACGDYEC